MAWSRMGDWVRDIFLWVMVWQAESQVRSIFHGLAKPFPENRGLMEAWTDVLNIVLNLGTLIGGNLKLFEGPLLRTIALRSSPSVASSCLWRPCTISPPTRWRWQTPWRVYFSECCRKKTWIKHRLSSRPTKNDPMHWKTSQTWSYFRVARPVFVVSSQPQVIYVLFVDHLLAL